MSVRITINDVYIFHQAPRGHTLLGGDNYQKDHMKMILGINFVKQAFHCTNYLFTHNLLKV